MSVMQIPKGKCLAVPGFLIKPERIANNRDPVLKN